MGVAVSISTALFDGKDLLFLKQNVMLNIKADSDGWLSVCCHCSFLELNEEFEDLLKRNNDKVKEAIDRLHAQISQCPVAMDIGWCQLVPMIMALTCVADPNRLMNVGYLHVILTLSNTNRQPCAEVVRQYKRPSDVEGHIKIDYVPVPKVQMLTEVDIWTLAHDKISVSHNAADICFVTW